VGRGISCVRRASNASNCEQAVAERNRCPCVIPQFCGVERLVLHELPEVRAAQVPAPAPDRSRRPRGARHRRAELTHPFRSGFASKSALPRLIVEWASPVIFETAASPRPNRRSAPRPSQTTTAPARRASSRPRPIAIEIELDHKPRGAKRASVLNDVICVMPGIWEN
jgi:hypothetical protein